MLVRALPPYELKKLPQKSWLRLFCDENRRERLFDFIDDATRLGTTEACSGRARFLHNERNCSLSLLRADRVDDKVEAEFWLDGSAGGTAYSFAVQCPLKKLEARSRDSVVIRDIKAMLHAAIAKQNQEPVLASAVPLPVSSEFSFDNPILGPVQVKVEAINKIFDMQRFLSDPATIMVKRFSVRKPAGWTAKYLKNNDTGLSFNTLIRPSESNAEFQEFIFKFAQSSKHADPIDGEMTIRVPHEALSYRSKPGHELYPKTIRFLAKHLSQIARRPSRINQSF
ncbi:MAG: hypothetical protein OXU45_08185 [Candidatus Melainabacteria bacterium]|nr:hypothetical protein [Candidatus Melainabacteria bacterium]